MTNEKQQPVELAEDALEDVTGGGARMSCQNNLKQLGLGVQSNAENNAGSANIALGDGSVRNS